MKPESPLRKATNSITALFSRLLAPAFCISCRTFLDRSAFGEQNACCFCKTCLSLIKPVVSVDLSIKTTGYRHACSQPIRVFALSDYQDPLKQLIRAKNYGNFLAAQQLGALMIRFIPAAMFECDYLVAIPLHWTRRAQRGFNQSTIIARALGAFLNKPVIDCLKRTRRSPFQAQLDAQARKENMRAIFLCTQTGLLLKNKHVVIIDDLMTTGATLNAACNALRSMQPASLKAYVACRTL